MPKAPEKVVVYQKSFGAWQYSENSLRHALLQWKEEFKEHPEFRKGQIQIVLVHKGRVVAKEWFPCSRYSDVDSWDLWQDPGHVRGKQMHMVNWSCTQFDHKCIKFITDNKPNLKDCRIRIRLVERD